MTNNSMIHKITNKFKHVKHKFKRPYVPTTTPDEVKAANELKSLVATDLADYIYVDANYDVNSGLGVGAYVSLAATGPAQQNVHVATGYSSQLEISLLTLIDALNSVPLEVRQAKNVAVVLTNVDVVKAFNDFSMLAKRVETLDERVSTDRLQAQLVELTITFRSLRMSVAMPHEAAFTQLLQTKITRIKKAHKE
ncbi:MAG: hypothetical protein LBT80_00565 [Lactobacillaceae bacterium]|nr:hypothetical protein [Lactobacillaceae bacterium]